MQGETGHNGAQFVVDNCGGHILDTPVEIVWLDESCVYRKLKLGRSGGEVRPGWRVN
jgi:hypothetical protein